jgi:hypothetical protein
MSNLAPGDLCEIIRSEQDTSQDRTRGLYGKIVVLLRVSERPHFNPKWAPYWKCAGINNNISVSHLNLRKLPPAPLEMEPREEESVV